MAIIVCCPCGHPLDCERLDIVVTIGCPECRRDLQIELEDERRGRIRAVLTVMEGPSWVGEQFVMPVGQDLILGRAPGNWLSLDSDVMAGRQCRLKLTQRGAVQIEDLESETGTWIGPLRIAKGKLRPEESFRIGEYRLRLDFLGALGGEVVSKKIIDADSSGVLPELQAFEPSKSLTARLCAQRFVIARQMIVAFAWITAAYHGFALRAEPFKWEGYWCVVVAAAMLSPLLIAGQRVALVHRYLKFAVVGVVAAIGLVDVIAWTLPKPAIGALVFAAGLPLLTVERPSEAKATCGAILSGLALVFCLVLAILAAEAAFV